MRVYKVPAMFEEKPKEIGGWVTFKQGGYLGAGGMLALLSLADLPLWLGGPLAAGCVGAALALSFARYQRMPLDRVVLLWWLYVMRPRELIWRREGGG